LFWKYFKTIIAICEDTDAEIRIILYNNSLKRTELTDQFSSESEVESHKYKKFAQVIKARLIEDKADTNSFSGIDESKVPSVAGLINQLLSLEDHWVSEIKSKRKCNEEEFLRDWQVSKAPFFLWIRGDEEAVFTFNNVHGIERGFSFRTSHSKLVDQFNAYFNVKWDEFKKKDP
jgi:hypothetical protein